MIIRIVKLTFKAEVVADFTAMFNRKKDLIRNVKGCNRLELLRDKADPNVYFTYSWWESETDLNEYRYSELFKETWKETKSYFSDKPEAWSLEKMVELT